MINWGKFVTVAARLCVALPVLSAPSLLYAAEFFAQPAMGVSVDADDNRRLATPAKSAVTSLISPRLQLGVRTPVLDLTETARADIIRSTDNLLDSENVLSDLLGAYKSQLNTWKLRTFFQRDSLLTTLPIAVTENSVPDREATGLDNVTRNRLRIEPGLERVLTERTRLELGYQFNLTTFDAPGTTGFEDYKEHTATVGLDYEYSPRDTLISEVEYTHFDSNDTQLDQYSLGAGLEHLFSENLKGRLVVGGRRTEVDSTVANAGNDTDFTVHAVLTQELPTGALLAEYRRDVRGSGFGNALQVNQIDIRWDKEIVPNRWHFRLAARFADFDRIGSGATGSNATLQGQSSSARTYYQFQPGIVYRLTPQFSLDLSYRYRRNERKEPASETDSNAVILTMLYQFDPFSVSR